MSDNEFSLFHMSGVIKLYELPETYHGNQHFWFGVGLKPRSISPSLSSSLSPSLTPSLAIVLLLFPSSSLFVSHPFRWGS